MTEKSEKPKKAPKRIEKAASADKYLKITLVRSLIGYPRSQRAVARGLGLRRLQSHVVRRETPDILGMVHKIGHVLKVEAVEKP